MVGLLQSYTDVAVGEVTFLTPHYELQGKKSNLVFSPDVREHKECCCNGLSEADSRQTDTSNTEGRKHNVGD